MKSVESILSNSSIKVDTVSNTMQRLRLIQGVFIFFEEKTIWIVNTNQVPVKSLQIILEKTASLFSEESKVETRGKTVAITEVAANSIVKFKSDKAVTIQGRRSYAARGRKFFCQKIAHAKLYVNLSDSDWQIPDTSRIRPKSFYLEAPQSGTGLAQLSNLTFGEELFLILGQLWIVTREILFKGRSVNSTKYLDDSKEIKLEDHDNW